MAAGRIIEQYAPSVALLHVVVTFKHTASGKAVTIARNARADDNQNLTLELDGGSPEFRLSFGTGFVATNGPLLTNHPVAEPWWQDEQIGGVRPIIQTMEAYFPGFTTPLAPSTAQVSQTADLSMIKVANLEF